MAKDYIVKIVLKSGNEQNVMTKVEEKSNEKEVFELISKNIFDADIDNDVVVFYDTEEVVSYYFKKSEIAAVYIQSHETYMKKKYPPVRMDVGG